MLELVSPTTPAVVETVTLFTIDGKPYDIPKTIDAAFALRTLKAMRTKGELVAMAEMFEGIIGEEAYEALCAFKGLTGPQLKQLMDEVTTYVMGQVEDVAGN